MRTTCYFLWAHDIKDGEPIYWKMMHNCNKVEFKARVCNKILDQYELMYESDLIDIYYEKNVFRSPIYIME